VSEILTTKTLPRKRTVVEKRKQRYTLQLKTISKQISRLVRGSLFLWKWKVSMLHIYTASLFVSLVVMMAWAAPAHANQLQLTTLPGADLRWEEVNLIPGEATRWQIMRLRNDADESARLVMTFDLASTPSGSGLGEALALELVVLRDSGSPPDQAACDNSGRTIARGAGTFTPRLPISLAPPQNDHFDPGEAIWLCQRAELSPEIDNTLQGGSITFDQSFVMTSLSGQVLGARDSGVRGSGIADETARIGGTVLGARDIAGTGMPLTALPLGLLGALFFRYSLYMRLFIQRRRQRMHSSGKINTNSITHSVIKDNS